MKLIFLCNISLSKTQPKYKGGSYRRRLLVQTVKIILFLNILGIPSKLDIVENSLSFELQSNNTFLIRAKLDARVSAKTWIWKGINFGLLGCLKITSCSGEVVTYTANIDMELSTQVLWKNDKMSILIKPVDTAINNVNVRVSF